MADFSKFSEITGSPERITNRTTEIRNDEFPIPAITMNRKVTAKYQP